MVQNRDVPFQSKWEPSAPNEPVECRTLFGLIPCHDGFTYNEPEGGGKIPTVETDEKPVDPPKCERPRERKKDKKNRGNNGWGNGDQDAPGNSGPNNNAENGPKGNHDGRGKGSANSGNGKNR